MSKKVIHRDRSTIRQRGPCLTCHAPDIQYGRGGGRGLYSTHVTYGDSWLDRNLVAPLAQSSKPFEFIGWEKTAHEPATRCGLSVVYDTRDVGHIYSINGIAYYLLKPYVCSDCREELNVELSNRVAKARQREAQEEAKRRFEATWRRAQAGEFPMESGSRSFALVFPTLSFLKIEFNWRTSALYCRGPSPAFVMLMTVDGVFSGRCCQTYEAITSADGEGKIEAEEYWATDLLARWIQNNLQADLLTVRPSLVWDASVLSLKFVE